ncbi:hypothetical protein PSR1_01568 [Anaeromyxobacter sp. PSR-1]|nr:hypothetical protein PSR1_01568 [Anaeromyxobacter sp. PSR-1]
MRAGEPGLRRDHPVLERQHRAQHAHRGARAAQVAHVRLGRADGHRAGDAAVALRQRGELGRVAARRAGRVALHEADGGGIDRALLVRPADGEREAVRVRRERRRGGAVAGAGHAEHHGQDAIAVAERVVEPLRGEHHRALARQRPVGGGVERARAVGGEHAHARERHQLGGREQLARGAEQRAVHRPVAERARRHVQRGEARREAGVHRRVRAAQVEQHPHAPGRDAGRRVHHRLLAGRPEPRLERGACGRERRLGRGRGHARVARGLAHRRGERVEPDAEPGVRPPAQARRAEPHAGALARQRLHGGQRLAPRLQHLQLPRVHRLGVRRRHPEGAPVGTEPRHLRGRREPAEPEPLPLPRPAGERLERIAAGLHGVPERLDAACARKHTPDADEGDRDPGCSLLLRSGHAGEGGGQRHFSSIGVVQLSTNCFMHKRIGE